MHITAQRTVRAVSRIARSIAVLVVAVLVVWVLACVQARAGQQPHDAQAERVYRLSTPAARSVVRVLRAGIDDANSFGTGTGVLVGRCDVMVSARHVLVQRGGAFLPKMLSVHSPQIRGNEVKVLRDDRAQALWPIPAGAPAPSNAGRGGVRQIELDKDIAVVRLSACPTHSSISIDKVEAPSLAQVKAPLISAGFACDSSDRRAPEILQMTGRVIADPGGPLVVLQPGARPGQSGAPIFSTGPDGRLALHMVLVAGKTDANAPMGCGIDQGSGKSAPHEATFAAVLSRAFIKGLDGYISALNKEGPPRR